MNKGVSLNVLYNVFVFLAIETLLCFKALSSDVTLVHFALGQQQQTRILYQVFQTNFVQTRATRLSCMIETLHDLHVKVGRQVQKECHVVESRPL